MSLSDQADGERDGMPLVVSNKVCAVNGVEKADRRDGYV